MNMRWTGPTHLRQLVFDLAQKHMAKAYSLYAVVAIEPAKQGMVSMSIGTCNLLPTAREMVEGLQKLPPGSTMSVWRNEGLRKRVLDGTMKRV